jgi:hypothetical protein
MKIQVQDNILIFRVVTINIATAKIAIMTVVFCVPPFNWTSNLNVFFFPVDSFLKSSTQTLHTLYGALISQLHTKIGVAYFSNETCNVLLMFFNHKCSTDMIKPRLDMLKAQHNTK